MRHAVRPGVGSVDFTVGFTACFTGVVHSIACSLLGELLCDDDMPGMRCTPSSLFESQDEGIKGRQQCIVRDCVDHTCIAAIG